ncbi:MAG: Hpt domain-containing protein [Desulfuromonadaceae bacterium]|nr:Hpt domain-containing protein [Desulfuromonadaceae bacterium]MDD2855094.1 Hpt domain-containing protein [Desulfuromonadaceae bacterium]
MVDLYLTCFADTGYQLAEKLEGDDLKDIKEFAHSLKGMVASIGGYRLMETANLIQEMCREGNKPDYAVWAPIITAQPTELKEAMEQLDWNELERLAAGK